MLTVSTSVRVLAGHPQDVLTVSIAADGLTVLSASKDGGLFLWSLPSGKRFRGFAGRADWEPSRAAKAPPWKETSRHVETRRTEHPSSAHRAVVFDFETG